MNKETTAPRTLITGSSKGIGKALAFEFAQNGHDLVLVARDERLLEQIAALIKLKYAVDVDVIAMDLSHSGSALNLVETIAERNLRIDCLVNNAGVGFWGDFTDMGSERLNSLIQLNMMCVSELTHHYAQHFKKSGGGKILQVASTAGFQPGPKMAAYYASKAYVINFSRAMAYELKEHGVTVSILCPGPTETSFLEKAGMQGTFLERGFIGLMSATKVARVAYRGLQRNKLIIIPGIINKTLAFGARVFPAMITMRIAVFLHRK
ncbi:SDR family NAD(P)-dependent oxidoreductase [Legionella spiritensis]|uniref:SDR family NAD(P)-dependent oxidoreductase n=1 Tax=Legionella spiritensis TaxID=452 RepID=UPI000F818615|nr:SDR family oxidoreductase [Legionella spiritensis]